MTSATSTPSAASPVHATRELSEIARTICASYLEPALAVNHLREGVLPSRQATLQILEEVKDVLFPDYRLERQIRNGQSALFVGGKIERIFSELSRQIHFARSYDSQANGAPVSDLQHAEADAMRFLEQLKGLREMLALDVEAALDGDPAAKSFDEIIFCYPGFEAVAAYRIAHELYRLGVPLLPRIITEEAHSRTGCDIHPGANIGKSFFIDHATGVVIGETTVIGQRVKLYQGVTLGALSFPKDEQGRLLRNLKRHPTIEDDVVIYAGATVLGGDTVIGAGSVIGGSCWITHSIPPGTKVQLADPQMRFRGPRTSELPSREPEWMI